MGVAEPCWLFCSSTIKSRFGCLPRLYNRGDGLFSRAFLGTQHACHGTVILAPSGHSGPSPPQTFGLLTIQWLSLSGILVRRIGAIQSESISRVPAERRDRRRDWRGPAHSIAGGMAPYCAFIRRRSDGRILPTCEAAAAVGRERSLLLHHRADSTSNQPGRWRSRKRSCRGPDIKWAGPAFDEDHKRGNIIRESRL